VGSALSGSREFVAEARRFRKQFGGGMRQAGIIAAGAIHALTHHRERLAEDHANAKRLASGLSGIPGIQVDPDTIDTNMVYFDIVDGSAAKLSHRLKEMNVLALPSGGQTIRAVTSLEVDTHDIARAIEAVRGAMTA
jgi:threonine aldolase